MNRRTPDRNPESSLPPDRMSSVEMERVTRPERIMVKIGTSASTDSEGDFNYEVANNIISQIEALKAENEDHEIILVTSGAIGLGMKKLGLKTFPQSVKERQKCSLFGMYELAHCWQEVTDRPVSGHWVTHDIFKDQAKLADFHQGLRASVEAGGIPVINENDGVSVEEMERTFGDNDTLAALLAVDLAVDRLVIISDVPGLHDKNPHVHADAELIKEVHFGSEVPADLSGKSDYGRGGMSDKHEAIKLATKHGIPVYLTNPETADILVPGDNFPGTHFRPSSHRA